MTEQNEQNKTTKPLTLSTTRTGAAAKSDATQVRQKKFSHGRTRAVTVEVKKPVKRDTRSAQLGARAHAPRPGSSRARAGSRGAQGCPAAGRPYPEARWRRRSSPPPAIGQPRAGADPAAQAVAGSCCAR